MSAKFQRQPARVTIESEPASAPAIHQIVHEVAQEEKFDALIWLLRHHKPASAIVFCNLKATTKDLAKDVNGAGFSAASLSGDLEQYERDRVMVKFRNRSTRILVATDVAARGLDIEDLDIVFNFDMPAKADAYIHRIGRTGRAGKKGLAISLLTPREKFKLQTIETATGTSLVRKKLTLPSSGEAHASTQEPVQRTAAMATIRIGGGRKEKLRPGDILGALTGEAGGFLGADVGKIEIHDHYAYVAVAKHLAARAIKCLADGRIKGRKFRVELVL